MSHQLTFASRLAHDPARASISLPVEVLLGDRRALAPAKLDTVASPCVFRRESARSSASTSRPATS